jgi:transposase
MTPRKGKGFAKNVAAARAHAGMELLQPHAAGIDVHAYQHYVAVPVDAVPEGWINPEPNLPPGVRVFGTNTGDLEARAAWLQDCGVKSVALESTGVYGDVLLAILEQHGLEVVLVHPQQTATAPGRPKTDVLDCQWIQRLHSYGLLRASFRPSAEIRELRSYQRHREMLIRSAASHIHHMQKALEQMNVKLTEVVSDITGKTGMSIIKAILRGQRDACKLAKYRHGGCKATEAQIASALLGTWSEAALFELRQALKLYEEYQRRLQECAARIEQCLRQFADRSAGQPLPKPVRQLGRKTRGVSANTRQLLYQLAGVDVTLIEGIDETTALVLLCELGYDLSKFPTERHFTSWLGLSPNHRGSGGKIKKRRVRPGANRAARALRMAAQGCHHAKHALGAFYRRIAARCGGPKAVVATARKIAERFWRLLTKGMAYVRQGMDDYEKTYQFKLTRRLAQRAAELGCKLVPVALTPEPEPEPQP